MYNRYRDVLSVLDGVPMYIRRVIVPADLRREVLQCLHYAQQGTSEMNERALHVVFWLDITTDIEKIRQGCVGCDTNAPTQMLEADYCNIKGKS